MPPSVARQINQFGGSKTGRVLLLFCFFSLGVNCDVRAALLWNYFAGDDAGNSLFGQLTTDDGSIAGNEVEYQIQSFDTFRATKGGEEVDLNGIFTDFAIPTVPSLSNRSFQYSINAGEIDYETLSLSPSNNALVGIGVVSEGQSGPAVLGLTAPGTAGTSILAGAGGGDNVVVVSFEATTLTITPVPEPEVILPLVAMGLLALGVTRRRGVVCARSLGPSIW